MPSWKEVVGEEEARGENENKAAEVAQLPIHVKKVGSISSDALAALTASEATKAEWKEARRWLEDVKRYDGVPRYSANGAPAANMSDADVATLREFGVVEEIRRCEVQGWTKMFCVPELAKNRRRPIKHTFVVNDALGKETAPQCNFVSKLGICDLVHKGTHFIALDFSAYYDQFLYTADVGKFFCFREGKKFFRLRTLAMGQRQAVGVAHTATRLLLDFDKRSHTEAIIDNVIFVGSRADVLRDAATFVERVKAVGGTLNEDVTNLEALIATTGDWCGVHLDMERKTAALMQKALDKVEYAWNRRDRWTWRNFSAFIGLLFWSWGILDVPMAEFFPLLRFISHASASLADSPHLWDEPAAIWSSAWPSLEKWRRIVAANTPRVVKRNTRPEWLVCTDASAWGWGYTALNTATADVRMFGAPWSTYMRQTHGSKLGRSTFAEPHAVFNSMCHLLKGGAPCTVRVGTDNTVAQASYARGFNSHSHDINECLRRLRSTFGDGFTFEYVYIPGVSNPADSFSRGRERNGAEDREIADSLRRLLG